MMGGHPFLGVFLCSGSAAILSVIQLLLKLNETFYVCWWMNEF